MWHGTCLYGVSAVWARLAALGLPGGSSLSSSAAPHVTRGMRCLPRAGVRGALSRVRLPECPGVTFLLIGASCSHVHTRSRSPNGGAGVPWLGRRRRPPPRPDGWLGPLTRAATAAFRPSRLAAQGPAKSNRFAAETCPPQAWRLRHQGEMISLFCRPAPLSEVAPECPQDLTLLLTAYSPQHDRRRY